MRLVPFRAVKSPVSFRRRGRFACAFGLVVLPVASLFALAGPRAQAQTPPSGPADPPPMKERARWIFELRFDHGDVYLVSTQREELAKATPTGRVVGRFALELFEGPALIERVRFDFPLLAPPRTTDAGLFAPPEFAGATGVSRIGVMFPATSKGVRLELLDRATGRRWSLPWPPVETADAG